MSTSAHHCTNITKKEDAKQSTVTLTAEIAWEHVEKYRAKAIKNLQKEAVLDGFRKGHVPEHMIVSQLGEGTILQETADVTIKEELPLLLAQEQVPGISTPQVQVTKLAPQNPLCFTVIIEVLPKIELPDYRALAQAEVKKKEEVTVTDEEVQGVLNHLRRERAKIEFIEKGEKPETATDKVKELEEKDLPPIDDEFVKGLGYESAVQFTEKLRENVKTDKEAQAKDKTRIALLEAIMKKADFAVPHSLIHHELYKMEAQFSDELVRAGTTFDDYLKQINKTRSDIHKEWHESAEKRAKTQLILSEIAVKEGIKADEIAVKNHIEHTLKNHKDVTEENARAYFEHMLRNEAVLVWLEQQK